MSADSSKLMVEQQDTDQSIDEKVKALAGADGNGAKKVDVNSEIEQFNKDIDKNQLGAFNDADRQVMEEITNEDQVKQQDKVVPAVQAQQPVAVPSEADLSTKSLKELLLEKAKAMKSAPEASELVQLAEEPDRERAQLIYDLHMASLKQDEQQAENLAWQDQLKLRKRVSEGISLDDQYSKKVLKQKYAVTEKKQSLAEASDLLRSKAPKTA